MKLMSLVVILLLIACAPIPPIQPVDADLQFRIETGCRSIYPVGRWQLVHTIHARLHHGHQAALTGVIILSTADSQVHCVLMTLEGFVLFEAVDDGDVSVKRAFGPFDNPEFAAGVMRDIRLIFLAPAGQMQAAGNFADGAVGCRYRSDDNRFIDVINAADGSWRIQQYDPLKTVVGDAIDPSGFSPQLTLEAAGKPAYTLVMKLVEAVPMH
ncbi:hypothetical protein [Desulfosarcina sp.]|uniref:hypothetical protein n=1 Tax=Desulfosarcina sp. TaxID=2027861 RepID=UPI003970CFA9